jgi:hypothetical protein
MKALVLLIVGLQFFLPVADVPVDPSKFPVPPYSKKSLFYIHRSPNANTVVYELNAAGTIINSKDPVTVYWMRYGESGQQRELNYLEKTFAYGVKCSAINDLKYSVEFVASKAKKLEVFIDENGQACALMNISGKPSRLRKVYVQVAEDGWWPRVAYVEFFGFEITTNKPAYEKMDIQKLQD